MVRPTMRDVASTAGVSLKTVSRVVNREPGVRAETAARVDAAIAGSASAQRHRAQRSASGRAGRSGS